MRAGSITQFAPSWLIGLATDFNTVQVNGHDVPNEEDQYLNTSVSQMFAGYNFNNWIGVQFNLLVIYGHTATDPAAAAVQAVLRARFGGVFEDLLDMNVHLPQKGRRDGVAVAFVGQDGGAALKAQRLEDGFRNPVGQAHKSTD